MKQILVSVIVPIYNVEKYLKDCLSSLERQTLKNIEVIMVNDGSTDGSPCIAEEYARKNKNFFLINRPNGGLSAARNTGMRCACGKYIYFLDSDDYLLDEALERLYIKAEKDNLDVLKFVAYTFSDTDKELKWGNEDGYKYKGHYPGVYRGLDILQRFVDNKDEYQSCCLIFVKSAIIYEYSLTFLEGIIHEDHLFQWELLSISQRVAVLNEPLYCRRIRQDSITTRLPDWKMKTYSMSQSMIEADRFVERNQWIKGETTAGYLIAFAWCCLNYWILMKDGERDDEIVQSYYENIAPLVKKYGYGNSKRLWLFFTNRRLFMICKKIKSILLQF